MVTYINKTGHFVLYETTVTLRGGKKAIVQSFFPENIEGEKIKNWRVANKVRAGYEIVENKRLRRPFVCKIKKGTEK